MSGREGMKGGMSGRDEWKGAMSGREGMKREMRRREREGGMSGKERRGETGREMCKKQGEMSRTEKEKGREE